MLEIPSVSSVYPVKRPGKIKKNDRPLDQLQGKKKQASEEQEVQPVQHIDEIV